MADPAFGNQHRLPSGSFRTSRRVLRVLCLSGGGYRGLFSARVLAQIERRLFAGQSIAGKFDLLAGTSVGGLLASGLAVGQSAGHLQDTLVQWAPRIFPARRWRRLRKALAPPYDPHLLADAVIACLGRRYSNTRLDAIDRPLFMPAVSWVFE